MQKMIMLHVAFELKVDVPAYARFRYAIRAIVYNCVVVDTNYALRIQFFVETETSLRRDYEGSRSRKGFQVEKGRTRRKNQ